MSAPVQATRAYALADGRTVHVTWSDEPPYLLVSYTGNVGPGLLVPEEQKARMDKAARGGYSTLHTDTGAKPPPAE
jgi:hypothetical protein